MKRFLVAPRAREGEVNRPRAALEVRYSGVSRGTVDLPEEALAGASAMPQLAAVATRILSKSLRGEPTRTHTKGERWYGDAILSRLIVMADTAEQGPAERDSSDSPLFFLRIHF
jgi:hypothetical protein